jgi:hypothetical protein
MNFWRFRATATSSRNDEEDRQASMPDAVARRKAQAMAGMSRRQLLGTGSLGVVAAGVAAALPAAAATGSVTAAHDRAVASDAQLDGPLIAHVTDVKHGRISVYVDDREVTIVDRDLAARLYTATR